MLIRTKSLKRNQFKKRNELYERKKKPIRKENPDYIHQFKLTIELGIRRLSALFFFIFKFVSIIIKTSLIKKKVT